MQTTNSIPEWDTLVEALKVGLGYSDATLKRTRYTYNVFIRDYCGTKGGNAENVIKQGIVRTGDAYESGMISKDKLLRIRRLAFRMLQLIETGHITWKCAPLYGKKYGNDANEALLGAFVATEQRESRHAESIIMRDENIIRQYILYAEENKISIPEADAKNMLDFLSHMKELRPAGLHSTASALKHFYGYLIENGYTRPNILAAIKAWDTPHKRIYGTLTDNEKEKLLDAADKDSDIGKRDKAILMLAMDCGVRSSDLCNLKLRDIDWHSASINIIQKKTGKQVSIPFSERTGNALADYILNARGSSSLPYVFLKKSYSDSSMTSALLCHRFKKLMQRAGITRPAAEKINMHMFRRSLGTSLIDSGESLEMVAQILGHMEKKGIPYDEISLQEWNAQTISDYLVYLKNERNVSASTRNQRLFAIRSFLKYARISHPEITALFLEASGIAVAKESKEPVVFLSENAMATLLRQPDDTTRIGLRDMCFMITMYDTAARDCEMLNLRLNSLDLKDGSPKIRLEGKDNKVRYVPLMKKTVSHLKRYIRVFHSEDAREEDWLFYTVSHGKHNKMSDDNVARFLKKYTIMAREACDEMPSKVTPHQFRHTRAMHLYRHGMSLQLLAEYMGHASVISTQIYAYADTEMKRRAIEKCQGGAAISGHPEWQNNVEMIKKLYGLA